MGTPVIMPQLGESVVEGKVSRWLKKIGEPVKLYEPILEVETDKVTTEVTAAGEGTLLKLYANEGDVVKAGTLIAFIGAVGEADPHPTPYINTAPGSLPERGAARRGNGASARISPVVARIAAEHDIDVALVHGTGEGGRPGVVSASRFRARRTRPGGGPARIGAGGGGRVRRAQGFRSIPRPRDAGAHRGNRP